MTSTRSTEPKYNSTFGVLSPIRNGSLFFPVILDRILNQTYRHFELNVINDGSTDDRHAWLVARALRDDRLRLVANSGQDLMEAVRSQSK